MAAQEKCSAFLSPLMPLSRFCSLAAHHEAEVVLAAACLFLATGACLGLSPACSLFSCLTLGTALDPSSSLP